ncbi:MAG: amidohydrolase family protein [Verrucomicrobiales bacterium]|nr:amidohydrolase family protein [Verrucomicrobiales bacterium]
MKRRKWMQMTASAAVAGLASEFASAEDNAAGAPRVIDTHTHFYDPSRPQGVPWPPQDSALYRTVLPPDWLAVASPHGVRETVVVEASQWVEDNQWILDLAEKEPCIVGFVGNLDPRDEAFEANVKRFAANRLFVGVRWRSGLVDVDEDFPRVLAGARILAEHNLELDLNGRNASTADAVRLAREVPDLRIVIDHLGNPRDSTRPDPEWKEAMSRLAEQPNVNMKISALVEATKTPPGQAPTELDVYRATLDHLWQAFGVDRWIYGSNWPVSDRGAPYTVVWDLAHRYISEKGEEAAAKFYSENARRVYRWVDRRA